MKQVLAPAFVLAIILIPQIACQSQTLVDITGGVSHVCGIRPDGSPVCWEIGVTDYHPDPGDDEDSPPKGEKLNAISSGPYHVCGLRPDRTAVCWGNNRLGQATPPQGADRGM